MQALIVGRAVGREVKKLSAIALKTLGEGNHPDGGGLYFQRKGAGSSWLYRFQIDGRERWMGLGRYPDVSLKDARTAAKEARRLRGNGKDPIEHRRAERIAKRLAEAGTISFKDAAREYIATFSPTWKNKAHRAQWASTLRDYAFPAFGDLPVSEIQTSHVLKALTPIWAAKAETANRVRGRIEKILDWAAVTYGLPRGDNPAAWKGHLQLALPPRSTVRKVRHQPALAYADVPGFVRELRERGGVTPLALE